jgi:hypothetical protein
MRNAVQFFRQQWLGSALIVLLLGGAASAATGDFLRLGARNSAGRTTKLENTGNGAALQLKVKQGQPPLTVNSTRQVRGLNASLLSGKTSRSFAPASGSPNYAPASGSPNYAPADGSPNYAPADGSPNYAPADGSPNYAPADGSPNYAPADGSPNYAPADGSPNYAPADGSPNYAPADGSPNYQAAGSLQLLTKQVPGTFATNQTLLAETSFTAPAPGDLFVTLWGVCTTTGFQNFGKLRVSLKSPFGLNNIVIKQVPLTQGFCTVEVTRSVQAGEELFAQAQFFAPGSIQRANVVVRFVPG